VKTYLYKSDGAGIPGLPHRITEDEVKALPAEVARQFQAALEAGVFVEESAGRGDVPSRSVSSRKFEKVVAPMASRDEKE